MIILNLREMPNGQIFATDVRVLLIHFDRIFVCRFLRNYIFIQ